MVKKSNIPNQFYINLNGGAVLTFVKEDYPMGVRWLCSDDCRFYSDDGSTEIFPCMQIPDDGRTLFLFEEKGWANDYDAEYSDATGYDAINGFEDYINDVLASGVFIDYGDEDIMESTKKMKKSHGSWESFEGFKPGDRFEDRYGNWYEVYDEQGNFVWFKTMDVQHPEIPMSNVDTKESFLIMLRTGDFKPVSKSTKKMKKSIDEDAVFDFIKDSNSCCYGEIYDYCKDIGMSDQQINDAISNLKSEGKIDFVNQMDYVVKSTKKSTPSIHDMMAQIRANNNSLVKSRIEIFERE